MKQLQLITTQGCVGCKVMDNLIIQSLKKLHKVRPQLSYLKQDKSNYNKSFLASNNITDFPTVLVLIDNQVVFKHTGIVPESTILSWLLKYFGN